MLTEWFKNQAALAFFSRLDAANNGQHNGVSLAASVLVDIWAEELGYRVTNVSKDENTERVYGYGIPSVYQ